MKIGIIGTGISGLSLANMLRRDHEVILFEKEPKPGGLIKCERVHNCLFHKVGGHIFNARNQQVLEWFWSHFDKDAEFVKAKRNAKVFFDNKIIGYPIENHLHLLEKNITKTIIRELLQLNKEQSLTPFEYDNFESFLKGNFGNTLYDLYFKPYNEKIWQTALSSVSMEWLDGKLPMPNLLEIITSNINKEEEEGMVHSTFYYPKDGGSQFIVERLCKDLNIKTNENVTEIKEWGGKLNVQGYLFDKVVYCGDIRKLPIEYKKILSNSGVNVSYLDSLRANGTSNIFCETDACDISWLYIPQSFTKAHRIIYTGNFSEANNKGVSRKTCVVEFSGKVDYNDMLEEIKKLPGNLKPISSNYEPNSYVIQDKQTRGEVSKAKSVLEAYGIYLLGRFAEWEYYNMDKAIEAAFALKQKISCL